MAGKSAVRRVAVVGTSFGCQAHVRALQAAGFEVSALVGRDPERTREKAALVVAAIASSSRLSRYRA